MKVDILAFLGLMRRASALAIGEENASEAIGKGKARLLLLPSDGREKPLFMPSTFWKVAAH